MSNLDSILESSALQSNLDFNEYSKELAKDKANSTLNALNEEIRKQTGFDNFSGIITGGIGTIKGINESVSKAKEVYDKYKSRVKNNSENPADLKENTETKIKYRGFKETEPIQKIEKPIPEIPNLDEIDLIRKKNLLERGEELPNEFKTKMITPDIRKQFLEKSLQEDTFQENNKKNPVFTQNETGKITESLGDDIAEKLPEEAAGIGIGEMLPGANVVLDAGLIGFGIYSGVKDMIEQHKEHLKQNAYDRDMKRVQDIANQTHSIANVSAPTIKQLN
jgi:hypothetical protein